MLCVSVAGSVQILVYFDCDLRGQSLSVYVDGDFHLPFLRSDFFAKIPERSGAESGSGERVRLLLNSIRTHKIRYSVRICQISHLLSGCSCSVFRIFLTVNFPAACAKTNDFSKRLLLTAALYEQHDMQKGGFAFDKTARKYSCKMSTQKALPSGGFFSAARQTILFYEITYRFSMLITFCVHSR